MNFCENILEHIGTAARGYREEKVKSIELISLKKISNISLTTL